MNTNDLWRQFAKTGSVTDYLAYSNAVNRRIEENADKHGRHSFEGTEYRREGQAGDGSDA